ncbi:M20/M25/M40 family metallo-hydrolase [Microbacterium sp. SA39]|uniref:M20/M25/M40 family metallo-hydrolase n=1 Tax=Microbacterium sp. SA39 TaxID=1263625 RepID=UPI00061ECB87|nr:M20/M25/M40 family metallo-hydrolase [Microbacterium sp. SA39]KJQ53893.1 Acetylornithine deacetylase [Microbacterium sp. SA39]
MTGVIEIRDDVRTWLRQAPPIEDALAEMVSIPSFPATVEQNDVLDRVDALVGTPAKSSHDRWTPDWEQVESLESPVDAQRLWSQLIERDERYATTLPQLDVSVHTVGAAGPTLMLNGHVDVVPADGQPWGHDPYRPSVSNGRMYGRGTMDMKGGLVAAALAYRYLAENWSGPGRISFAAVPEEESGGNGTMAVIARGHFADAVVFAEPTNLEVVHRHVGIQAFGIDVVGRAGGMLRRSWGTSAAPTLARAAVALEELEERRTARAHVAGGYDPDDLPGFVNFLIHSGDWLATRAGTGELRGLMGVLPGETQEQAAAELAEAVEQATAGRPGDVTVWSHGGHRGAELKATHPLVTSFTGGAGTPDILARPTTSGTMVCDAKIVHGGGWAPAIVLGPTGDNLHAADEWVDLASIAKTVELLVSGAYRYFDA